MARSEPLTEQAVLRAFVARHGSQAAAADALGCRPQFMSSMLHGSRPIPVRVLEQLGVRRVTTVRLEKIA